MKLVARILRDLRVERERVRQAIADVYRRMPGHVDDHDLERYHLGMVTDQTELARMEEHLLACPRCVEQAEQVVVYVDGMRAAMVMDSEGAAPLAFPQIDT